MLGKHTEEEKMNYLVTIDAGTAKVLLPRNFDANSQPEFRQVYSHALDESGVTSIELDFSAVTYVDSSALGNLLLLRERVGKTKQAISFVHCGGAVMDALTTASFQRVFDIH
jgi:anti-anti-sigma factor